MRYEKVAVVVTVRFESFRELFQFLNNKKGQVYVDGENETDDVVSASFPMDDGTRLYYIDSFDEYESNEVVMARGILPDLSNVDEESLGEMFDLEAFRGEITTDGSRV